MKDSKRLGAWAARRHGWVLLAAVTFTTSLSAAGEARRLKWADAARAQHKRAVGGVVTIALPELGFLGWRWRDTLLALIGRDAHEPEFQTTPLLPDVAPTPLWMIYGTRDRFMPAAAARRSERA